MLLIKKCDTLSGFQYGFRSSQLTAGLLTVLSDRVVRAFNNFWAT